MSDLVPTAAARAALGALVGVLCSLGPALAANVGISAEKLVILDRTAGNGRARIAFVSRDPSIDKGVGTNPAEISARVEVFAADEPTNRAAFDLPSPWAKNSEKSARYANRPAPVGGGVEYAIARPGRLLRVVARSLGDDSSIDLFREIGPGGLIVVVSFENPAGDPLRLCTRFPGDRIDLREFARGTARRIIAKAGEPTECGRSLKMQPGAPNGFLSFPFPNDVRRRSDGSIDLSGYPGTETIPLLGIIAASGAQVTFGFGTNSPIYMQSDGPIGIDSLPSADDSTNADSNVMLANLDDPSAPRVPVLVDFKSTETSLRPANLLSILPYPGHALRSATKYTAIVFDGVRDEAGEPLQASPLLQRLDDPWTPDKPVAEATWLSLRAQRDAVLDYVAQHTAWPPSRVVGFTVFTTQDVHSEMEAVRAAIDQLPSPAPVWRSQGSCSGSSVRATVFGELDLPKWQEGVFPYTASGGGIVVQGGLAQQQSTERVDFEMTFPCGPAPSEGWPILLFMDGTGGCANSAFNSELGFAPLPYVVASISPLYSCERNPGSGDSEFVFFNFLNPLAGRTNQLQQAADLIYLRRVVEEEVLSAAETGNPTPVQTNDDISVVAGHSQGALTIPHILAVDDAFDGGFMSAGGGGFYLTLLQRGDIRALLDTLAGFPLTELDMFHPTVHVLQLLAEVGDGANHGARVQHAHVVSVGGSLDGCSPLEVINLVGTSMGLEVANPVLHPLFGSTLLEPPTVTLPAGGNLPDGRTGVTVELLTGHFGASTNPDIGRSFVLSLASGGTPSVDPGVLLPDPGGCGSRYSPLAPLP